MLEKITFPEHEYESVQNWLNKQGYCYTTRVFKEVGKYKVGESYLAPWGDVLRIDDVQIFRKVSDRPFYDEMSDAEKAEIRKYSEDMGLPYEFIRFSRSKMNLQDCFMLEDLFPRSFTNYEERPYGILFYNTQNKDSYDSNHAVIFRDKISNLSDTIKDILAFYQEKGLTPMIYQSARDNGYFTEIKDDLAKEGFDSWIEEQKFMVLMAENRITPNESLVVRNVQSWDPSFEQVFIEAEEPWETEVLRKSLDDPNTVLWVAYLEDKPIGVLYCLTDGKVCRGNYVLVSKQHRNVGAGKTLTYHYVEWCKVSGIRKAFHWPDGDRPEKIYLEAGFRHVETVYAGRAVYNPQRMTHIQERIVIREEYHVR